MRPCVIRTLHCWFRSAWFLELPSASSRSDWTWGFGSPTLVLGVNMLRGTSRSLGLLWLAVLVLACLLLPWLPLEDPLQLDLGHTLEWVFQRQPGKKKAG